MSIAASEALRPGPDRAGPQRPAERRLPRPADARWPPSPGPAAACCEADSFDETTRRQLLETIAEEANRLTRLLENILQMSRLELGGATARKAVEHPGGDRRLGPGPDPPGPRGHQVEVPIPPDLPLLFVDGLLLEQVFVNLLENAARYTPPGTTVDDHGDARTGTGWRSRSPTTAPACRPAPRSGSSRSSTGAARPPTPGGAAGWAWPSAGRSPRSTAGRSRPRIAPEAGVEFLLRLPLPENPPRSSRMPASPVRRVG